MPSLSAELPLAFPWRPQGKMEGAGWGSEWREITEIGRFSRSYSVMMERNAWSVILKCVRRSIWALLFSDFGDFSPAESHPLCRTVASVGWAGLSRPTRKGSTRDRQMWTLANGGLAESAARVIGRKRSALRRSKAEAMAGKERPYGSQFG